MNRRPSSVKESEPEVQGYPVPQFTGAPCPTVIPDDLNHVILVTGHRGIGKTTFCLGADQPQNILMLDYEGKGMGLARPLGVGGYFDIPGECANLRGFNYRPIEVFVRTRQILEAVPAGRFTTLVLDNATNLQNGCLAEVVRSPISYGIDPTKAASGQYGGAWPGVQYVIQSLLALAKSRGIKLIICTFQPKGAWAGGTPAFNKFKITDVKTWHEMSVLSLVLVEGVEKYFPAPSALVMKEQLAKVSWNPLTSEMEVIRRLPARLPKATFGEIRRYLENPVDFANLLPEERVTSEMLSPWLPTFSREQITFLQKLAEAGSLWTTTEGEE